MNKQQGVVILFAVLVIGFLVGVAAAISNLTQKQLILSNIGKQSQVAFYAADTGAECARYWDEKNNAFAKQDISGNFLPVTITCNNQNQDQMSLSRNQAGDVTTFQLTLSSPSGFGVGSTNISYNYCAVVTVTKNLQTQGTTIVSRGYNLPCVAQNSSRKVERAVQLTY